MIHVIKGVEYLQSWRANCEHDFLKRKDRIELFDDGFYKHVECPDCGRLCEVEE